jgi:hypothetical protein
MKFVMQFQENKNEAPKTAEVGTVFSASHKRQEKAGPFRRGRAGPCPRSARIAPTNFLPGMLYNEFAGGGKTYFL